MPSDPDIQQRPNVDQQYGFAVWDGSGFVSLQKLYDQSKLNVRYVCPLFQRPYAWKRSNHNQLWDDIQPLFDYQNHGYQDNKPLYLGTFLLRLFPVDLINKHVTTQDFLIVDGQQRLTTLSIIFLAVIKLMKSLKNFSNDPDFDQNNANKNLIETYKQSILLTDQRYLWEPDDEKHYNGRLRLIPTDVDRNRYQEIVHDVFGDELHPLDRNKDSSDSDSNIKQAFNFFYNKLRKEIDDRKLISFKEKFNFLQGVYNNLSGYILITDIKIPNNEVFSVNEIFNRHNSTGVDLATIDLVRNRLFTPFGVDYTSNQAKNAYNEYWKPFEESLRIPGTEKIDNSFFFYYARTYTPTASSKRAFEEVNNKWNNYFGEKIYDKKDQAALISLAVDEMKKFTPYFRLLAFGDTSLLPDECNSEVKEQLLRLHYSDFPKSAYSFLFEIIQSLDSINDKFFLDLLGFLETYFIRRFLCKRNNTGIDTVFKSLYTLLELDKKENRNIQTIYNSLPDSIAFLTDENVKDQFNDSPYTDRKKGLFVLRDYENHLRQSESSEEFADYKWFDYHIDHICPQDYAKNQGKKVYEYWGQIGWTEDFFNLIGSFGNLVVVTEKANKIKSNADFSSVKKKYEKSKNYSLSYDFKKILDNNVDWEPDKVRQRNEQIKDWAIRHWSVSF